MEVGKLKASSPIFYFIIDPLTPDVPNASRLTTYFVSTTIDSYIEAFYFLCRSLCAPMTDNSLRRWHNVYCKVFGSVTFDAFARSVQTLPVKHFRLSTSEAQARDQVLGQTLASLNSPLRTTNPNTSNRSNVGPQLNNSLPDKAPFSAPPLVPTMGVESNLVLYPTRDPQVDAAVELHRLHSELTTTQAQLRTEQSKQKVNGLADAERSALLYKVEQAQQEAETERTRSKEQGSKTRQHIQQLQDRLDRLVEQHEASRRDMTASERQRIQALEAEFLKREGDMRAQFEEAVRERDKKLHKASEKIQQLEYQTQELLRTLDHERTENVRLSHVATSTATDRGASEELLKKYKLQCDLLESKCREYDGNLRHIESECRKLEEENLKFKNESDRHRRESERYSKFASSLQSELKVLDDSSAAASALVRTRAPAVQY